LALEFAIDPVSPLLLAAGAIVAALPCHFSTMELPNIPRSVIEVQTPNPVLFEIDQLSLITLTPRVSNSHVACRSSLVPAASDRMAILKSKSPLPMKFIVQKSSLIGKHGVQYESAIDHLSVPHLSLEDSTISKFYF
jgi:hypothetical protein